MALHEKTERLRWRREHPPLPATRPEEVEEAVEERLVHDTDIARLRAEISQLERMRDERQAKVRELRVEHNQLVDRAQKLQRELQGQRRELAKAQDDLVIFERDCQHAIELRRRHVAGQAHALAADQRELENLTGERSS
jgi:chromosome segregation ATPase